MSSRFPTLYLSHGGGPWSYMDGAFRKLFAALEDSLKRLPAQLDQTPRAVLVVSAHWDEPRFAVTVSARPRMEYDFSGFPEELYHIVYPAPGAPELARRAQALIQGAGLSSYSDRERGIDHGAYTILHVTYPEPKIPVFQVSLRSDYDPESHLKLGRALAPLRDEGVLIVGSGMSYHNLPELQSGRPVNGSGPFDRWLTQTLVDSASHQRWQRLVDWESAPFAREAHPHEEHLLPLHVAVGAAEHDEAQIVYHEDDFSGSFAVSSYRFG